MDYFADFKGFAILPGFRFDSYRHARPVDVARSLLEGLDGVYVEIGSDGVSESESFAAELTVAHGDLDTLLRNIDPDYMWIDVLDGDRRMYVVQRLVIGDQQISQIERRVDQCIAADR
ncbi:MAG: hypothetical protein ABIH41_00695 [Nanoarchaeota archaeon]